jgi:hypothetical protein
MSLMWIPASVLGVAAVLLACPVAGALPDGRVIELVTPIEIAGASPGSAVPAPSGDAVDFQAGPFGDAVSGGNTLYQARRTAGGWTTTTLTPADVVPTRPFAETAPVFVTAGLGEAIFTTEQPLGSAANDKGALNLFEVSSQGALTLISQGAERVAALDPATFDGATPEGDIVAFDSAESLVPAATGLQESAFQPDDYLYVRDVSEGRTELIDVNNEGALVNPEGAVLGNGNDLASGEPPAPGQPSSFTYLPADGAGGTTTHAISTNGSKVFFESPGPAADEVELTTKRGREIHLYMRKENKTTVQLDSGEGTAGARYMGASENGGEVFFVSDEGLAGDGFKDTELYLYDTEDERLTPISAAPAGAPAVDGAVYGVTAIANDGSRVYYVAKGRLATNENSAGEGASEGEPNLYVYDTLTEENTFIAQLGSEEVEGAPASGHAGRLTSYLDVERPAVPTPNGEVLVFVSRRDLTGESSNATAQVYRYDAGPETLTCISCGPAATGSASIGIAGGGPSGAIGGGSYDPPGQSAPMSSTGERIFFETESALVPEDENSDSPPITRGSGESEQEIPTDVDVYEWENGHVYLISAGQSGITSLQGVTPSGNDAFFSSSVNITGAVPDGYVSLYDARVGGGFAPPAQSSVGASCDSIESCQGTLAGPATFAVPGTSIVDGVSVSVSAAPALAPAQPVQHKKKKKRQPQKRKPKGHRAHRSKSHRAGRKAASGSERGGQVTR